MDEMERRHADAEAARQQNEHERQAAERARSVAEDSRMVAEHERRVVASEVRNTITTLTALLNRMEAVEELRRTARKGMP